MCTLDNATSFQLQALTLVLCLARQELVHLTTRRCKLQSWRQLALYHYNEIFDAEHLWHWHDRQHWDWGTIDDDILSGRLRRSGEFFGFPMEPMLRSAHVEYFWQSEMQDVLFLIGDAETELKNMLHALAAQHRLCVRLRNIVIALQYAAIIKQARQLSIVRHVT